MRIRVVRDLVAAGENLSDERRILFGVFADQEKRGPRLETIEDVEQRDGVGGGRAVIDRQPDFRFVRFEGAEDGAKPLAVWNEPYDEEEDVRKKNRGERGHEIHAEEEETEKRRDENEGQDRAARPARVVIAGLERHC